MTVIAYRDGVMAADRSTRACGVEFHETRKVARRADGALIGCAGMSAQGRAMRDWFLAGEVGERPGLGEKEEDSTHALIVRPDGRVEVHDMHGRTDAESEFGYHAIGSGFELALGAMAMGASAVRAVEVAIQHGVGRSGRLDFVAQGPMPEALAVLKDVACCGHFRDCAKPDEACVRRAIALGERQ